MKLTGQHRKRRALSGPIDAQQAEAFPLRDAQRHALHGNLGPPARWVNLPQFLHLARPGTAEGSRD